LRKPCRALWQNTHSHHAVDERLASFILGPRSNRSKGKGQRNFCANTVIVSNVVIVTSTLSGLIVFSLVDMLLPKPSPAGTSNLRESHDETPDPNPHARRRQLRSTVLRRVVYARQGSRHAAGSRHYRTATVDGVNIFYRERVRKTLRYSFCCLPSTAPLVSQTIDLSTELGTRN